MSRYCAVYYCKNKRGLEAREKGISFHRFPKDRTLLNEWLRVCKIENYETPGTGYSLCSDHFTPDCFTFTEKRRTIRELAVPTIFNFPSAEAYFATMESRRNSVFKRRGRPPKIRMSLDSEELLESNTFTPPSSPEDGRLMIDLSSPLPEQWVRSNTSGGSDTPAGIPATRYTSTPELINIASPHGYEATNPPLTPRMPPPISPMPPSNKSQRSYTSPANNYDSTSQQFGNNGSNVQGTTQSPIAALQAMQPAVQATQAMQPATQATQAVQGQDTNAPAVSSCMMEENTNAQVTPQIDSVYSLSQEQAAPQGQTQQGESAEAFTGFEAVYLEQMLMAEPADQQPPPPQQHQLKQERITPPATPAIATPMPVYAPPPPPPLQPQAPPPTPAPPQPRKEHIGEFTEADMNNPTLALQYHQLCTKAIAELLIRKKQLEIVNSERDDKIFVFEQIIPRQRQKIWELEQYISNRLQGAATHQPCNIPNCNCRSTTQHRTGKRKYERKVPVPPAKKRKTPERNTTDVSNSQAASYPKPGMASPDSIPSPMQPGQNSPAAPTLPNFSEITAKNNMMDYANQNMYMNNPRFPYAQNPGAYFEYVRRLQDYQAQQVYAQNYAAQAQNYAAQAQNYAPQAQNLSTQNQTLNNSVSQNFTAQNLANSSATSTSTSAATGGYQNYPQFPASHYYPYNNGAANNNVQDVPENWSNND